MYVVTKLSPAQYAELDRILWEVWDPIGVNQSLEARSEYQGYLPGIVTLLESGAAVARVWAYLDHLVRDPIGLPPDPGKNKATAEALVSIAKPKRR